MRSKTSVRGFGRVGVGCASLVLIFWGCGDANKERRQAAEVAATCSLNSDCKEHLVCVFAHCHVACNDDTDCAFGQRCVRVPVEDQEKGSKDANVCQLPGDADCSSSDDCLGDQRCAVDNQCRDTCARDLDCTTGQECAASGDCALPSELIDGVLRGAGGEGGAGSVSGPGAGGTDAGAPETSAGAPSFGGSSGGRSDGSGDSGDGAGGSSGSSGSSFGGNGNGGNGNGNGGSSNSAGESSGGTSTGSAGMATGQAGEAGTGNSVERYVEETDAPEPVENNDRDHVVPLPAEGSLWLPGGDQDWFVIDTPGDGGAQVIELLVSQESATRAYVEAYSALDDSQIGTFLVPQGTTTSVFVTVASGAKTHIVFRGNRAGRLNFERVAITQELDPYEPNNDRDFARPVELGEEIVAQQIEPYLDAENAEIADWYSVTLAAGDATVRIVEVPRNIGFLIEMMDETNEITTLPRFNPGVVGALAIEIPKAGVYRFKFTEHRNSSIVSFYSGVKPEHLSETYTVRIEQP